MKEIDVSRIVFIWIIVIAITLIYFSQNNTNEKSTFYHIGPSSQLIVLNIIIDTPLKYSLVIIYSIANNVIRNLNSNILRPWITHNIQDNTNEAKQRKISLSYCNAYEINTIYTIYIWFDFLIYIHLLLSSY